MAGSYIIGLVRVCVLHYYQPGSDHATVWAAEATQAPSWYVNDDDFIGRRRGAERPTHRREMLMMLTKATEEEIERGAQRKGGRTDWSKNYLHIIKRWPTTETHPPRRLPLKAQRPLMSSSTSLYLFIIHCCEFVQIEKVSGPPHIVCVIDGVRIGIVDIPFRKSFPYHGKRD